MDLKHLNANSNHSKNICSIRKQILTVQKWFAEFKIKFKPFKRDSKYSNANSNDSNNSNPNSNHSTGIRSIWIQIWNIRNGLEAFECKFESFERYSKHSNAISTYSTKHLNANSNHSKGIQSIQIQIPTIRIKIRTIRIKIRIIRNGFEAFKRRF